MKTLENSSNYNRYVDTAPFVKELADTIYEMPSSASIPKVMNGEAILESDASGCFEGVLVCDGKQRHFLQGEIVQQSQLGAIKPNKVKKETSDIASLEVSWRVLVEEATNADDPEVGFSYLTRLWAASARLSNLAEARCLKLSRKINLDKPNNFLVLQDCNYPKEFPAQQLSNALQVVSHLDGDYAFVPEMELGVGGNLLLKWSSGVSVTQVEFRNSPNKWPIIDCKFLRIADTEVISAQYYSAKDLCESLNGFFKRDKLAADAKNR